MRERKIWKKLKNKGTARLLAAAMVIVLLCSNGMIATFASTGGLEDGLPEQTEQIMEQSADVESFTPPESEEKGNVDGSSLDNNTDSGIVSSPDNTDSSVDSNPDGDVSPTHDAWNETGETIKEPTCTVPGEMKYTCTVEGCSETKTEEIPTVDHKDENKDGMCDVCGFRLPKELSEALLAFRVAMEELMALAGNEEISGDEYVEKMLAGVEKARELYEKLSDEEKALPDVVKMKGALDSFGSVMPLWGLEGNCGAPEESGGPVTEKVKWKMVPTGDGKYTLIISGNGAMADYTHSISEGHDKTNAPWAEDPSQIKNITKVVVENGVTKIGNYAFYGGSDDYTAIDLTTVIISDSVKSIGEGAFQNCKKLQSFNLSSVTKIGENAFSGCSGLSSVTLGSALYKIGDGAFSGCTSLTGKITIPNNVTTIGYQAFYQCKKLEEVEIPNSVTTIGRKRYQYSTEYFESDVFSGCIGLKKVTLPSGVSWIGSNMFSGCISLEEIAIPDSVEMIWGSAFKGCSQLSKVTFTSGSKLTRIENSSVFENCTSLSEITIPEKVTYIGNSAFKGCSQLSKVTFISSSTLKWIMSNAFENCTSLSEITIPGGVTHIGNSAFKGCSKLSKVTFISSSTLKWIISSAFENCTSLSEIAIPTSVEEIGSYAFQNSGLTSITIPDRVTNLGGDGAGGNVFNGCESLTSATLPKGIVTITQSLFANCTQLSQVNFKELTALKDIYASAFENTALTYVDLSETKVSTIVERAFIGCSKLEKIVLPATLGQAVSQTFGGAGLQNDVFPNSLKELEFKSPAPQFGNRASGASNVIIQTPINPNLKILVPVEYVDAYKKLFNERDAGGNGGAADKIVTASNDIHTWEWTTVDENDHLGKCTVTVCKTQNINIKEPHANFGSSLPEGITSPPNKDALHWSENVKGNYKYCGVCGYAKLIGSGGTKPVLTPVSSERTGKDAATATFKSDTAGTYYYVIVNATATPSVDEIKKSTLTGSYADSDKANGKTLATFDPNDEGGAKKVCIVLMDGDKTSNVIEIPVPPYRELDFGSVDVNNTDGKTMTVTIPSGWTDVSVTKGGANEALFSVGAQNENSLPVTFKPDAIGDKSGTLTIKGKDKDGNSATMTVAMTGTGVKLVPTTIERMSEANGEVVVKSSTSGGEYYYKVVLKGNGSGTAENIVKENKKVNVGEDKTGTITLNDLPTSEAYDVYVVQKIDDNLIGPVKVEVPPYLDFGSWTTGNTSAPKTVTIPTGYTFVSVGDVNAPFAATPDDNNKKVNVTFTPNIIERQNDTLTIQYKDKSNNEVTVSVGMTGTGANPTEPNLVAKLNENWTSGSNGGQPTKKLNIKNTGNAEAQNVTATIENGSTKRNGIIHNEEAFKIDPPGSGEINLNKNTADDWTITPKPGLTPGTYTAIITVKCDNGDGKTVEIPISFTVSDVDIAIIAKGTGTQTVDGEVYPTAKKGDTVTYTITLTNKDSQPAIVNVTDKLPEGLTLKSAGGGNVRDDDIITWNNVDVPVGGKVELVVTATVNGDSNAIIERNTATLEFSSVSKTATSLPIGVPKFGIVITKEIINRKDKYKNNDIIQYRITATNTGDSLKDLVLWDVMDNSLQMNITDSLKNITVEKNAGNTNKLSYQGFSNEFATVEDKNGEKVLTEFNRSDNKTAYYWKLSGKFGTGATLTFEYGCTVHGASNNQKLNNGVYAVGYALGSEFGNQSAEVEKTRTVSYEPEKRMAVSMRTVGTLSRNANAVGNVLKGRVGGVSLLSSGMFDPKKALFAAGSSDSSSGQTGATAAAVSAAASAEAEIVMDEKADPDPPDGGGGGGGDGGSSSGSGGGGGGGSTESEPKKEQGTTEKPEMPVTPPPVNPPVNPPVVPPGTPITQETPKPTPEPTKPTPVEPTSRPESERSEPEESKPVSEMPKLEPVVPDFVPEIIMITPSGIPVVRNAEPIPDSPYDYPTYKNMMPDPNDPKSPEVIVVIDDDDVPLAYRKATDPDDSSKKVYVPDSSIPLASVMKNNMLIRMHWALVNLILTILSVLAGIFALMKYIKKRREDEEEEEKEKTSNADSEIDDEEEEEKKRKKWYIISMASAVISVIAFILTEDMRQPMVFVDYWTILMLILALLTVPGIMTKRKKEEEY